MKTTSVLEKLDMEQWQNLAADFDDYNYRQLWVYGTATARRRNAESEHVGIFDGRRILALADIRIKRLGALGGIAYIHGGPLVRQNGTPSQEVLAAALEALMEEYVRGRKLVLRIQPTVGTPQQNRETAEVFLSAGFQPSTEAPGYRTLLLDLSPGPDALMMGLAKKWRYNLRKAMKDEFTLITGNDEELFFRFCSLYDGFREKKGFDVDLDPSFYADVQRQLPRQDRMTVSLAEKDGKLIAGHVNSTLGDTAVNLFRAMTPEGAQTQVSYLLQWNAIAAAAERNFRYYDMGGIDPEDNPGVYSFKKGVGGEDVTAAGPFECCPDAVRGVLVHKAETLYRKLHS